MPRQIQIPLSLGTNVLICVLNGLWLIMPRFLFSRILWFSACNVSFHKFNFIFFIKLLSCLKQLISSILVELSKALSNQVVFRIVECRSNSA